MKEIKEKVIAIFNKYYVGLSLAILSSLMYIYVIYQSDKGIDVGDLYIKIMLAMTYGAFVSVIVRHIIDRYKNNLLYFIKHFDYTKTKNFFHHFAKLFHKNIFRKFSVC